MAAHAALSSLKAEGVVRCLFRLP